MGKIKIEIDTEEIKIPALVEIIKMLLELLKEKTK